MQNQDSNQTQFAETIPVLESAGQPSTAKPQPDEVLAKKKSKTPLIIGGFALLLIAVFLSLLVMIGQSLKQNGDEPLGEDQQQRQDNGEIDPLLEEIYDLDDQLQASDPSIDEIPLPPVDMGLRLDPAKKR